MTTNTSKNRHPRAHNSAHCTLIRSENMLWTSALDDEHMHKVSSRPTTWWILHTPTVFVCRVLVITQELIEYWKICLCSWKCVCRLSLPQRCVIISISNEYLCNNSHINSSERLIYPMVGKGWWPFGMYKKISPRRFMNISGFPDRLDILVFSL